MPDVRSIPHFDLADGAFRHARAVTAVLKGMRKDVVALQAALAGAGVTDRLQGRLKTLGASAAHVRGVARAWRDYADAEGRAAKTSDWTGAQAANVKDWERATLAATRAVRREEAALARDRARHARAHVDGAMAVTKAMHAARNAMQVGARHYACDRRARNVWSDLFGRARAAGGPVAVGKTYLVGEKGPELFTPVASGTVISNAETRARLAAEMRARSNAWAHAAAEHIENPSARDRRPGVKRHPNTAAENYANYDAKAPAILGALMTRYGLTKAQAAGIVGNLGHESKYFTAYLEERGKKKNRNKGGVGWAQWTGVRRRQFEQFVREHNLDPTSDKASWRYLTEADTEMAGAVEAVRNTNTAEEAMAAFEHVFERSGDYDQRTGRERKNKKRQIADRKRLANRAYDLGPVFPDVTPLPLGREPTHRNPIIVGTRAAGGPVTRGSTYLAGERGPELFKASASTSINSGDKLAAARADLSSPSSFLKLAQLAPQADTSESITYDNKPTATPADLFSSSGILSFAQPAAALQRAVAQFVEQGMTAITAKEQFGQTHDAVSTSGSEGSVEHNGNGDERHVEHVKDSRGVGLVPASANSGSSGNRSTVSGLGNTQSHIGGQTAGSQGTGSKSVEIARGLLGRGNIDVARALGHEMHAWLWCADFANAVLAKAGDKGTGSSLARSFAGWGSQVADDAIQAGDVLVNNGHVGFAEGPAQMRNGHMQVHMISGNFGHSQGLSQVMESWERLGTYKARRGIIAQHDDALGLRSSIDPDQSGDVPGRRSDLQIGGTRHTAFAPAVDNRHLHETAALLDHIHHRMHAINQLAAQHRPAGGTTHIAGLGARTRGGYSSGGLTIG